MMMGLRLVDGVDLSAADSALPGARETLRPAIEDLAARDLLAVQGLRVRATPRGRLVLNRVAAEFLPGLG